MSLVDGLPVQDQLFDGRKIRVLTIVDNFTRVSPAIDVRQSYRGADVVATLERVAGRYGRPKRIRVDNGPEFVSKELDLWAFMHDVELDFSRPGKPTDNAFAKVVEWQVPGGVPERLLVPEPRRRTSKCEAWRRDYNYASEHPSVYVVEEKRLC